MPSYTVAYNEADWNRDELCWYQTLFQHVTTTDALIVSLIRPIVDTPPIIERAGIFTLIQDEQRKNWKLICWVQSEDIVLMHIRI